MQNGVIHGVPKVWLRLVYVAENRPTITLQKYTYHTRFNASTTTSIHRPGACFWTASVDVEGSETGTASSGCACMNFSISHIFNFSPSEQQTCNNLWAVLSHLNGLTLQSYQVTYYKNTETRKLTTTAPGRIKNRVYQTYIASKSLEQSPVSSSLILPSRLPRTDNGLQYPNGEICVLSSEEANFLALRL